MEIVYTSHLLEVKILILALKYQKFDLTKPFLEKKTFILIKLQNMLLIKSEQNNCG